MRFTPLKKKTESRDLRPGVCASSVNGVCGQKLATVEPARLIAVRIVVLGGTRFIGLAIVAELDRAGHEVLVVHRGQHEPDELGHVQHLHIDRAHLATEAEKLMMFQPDGAIDVSAMNGRDAACALRALPEGLRLLALSSGDVYRAFSSVHEGVQTDAVPLDESAPLRDRR